MKVIKIDKKDWAGGLEKSRNTYKLIGPVKEKDKDISSFKLLEKDMLPDLDVMTTRVSPKSIVFPQEEVMLTYTTDESKEDCNLFKSHDKDYSPRAVIGIRPFDAAAFLLVKKNFDTPDHRDPYWCDAYEACTFIGLAINNPDSLDFSPSTKTGPFDTSGLDLLLVETEDSYLAQVVTEKGEAYLNAAGWKDEAGNGVDKQIGDLKKAAEAKITSSISYDKIKSKEILDLYNADFWDQASFACINCGTCTYVCPTCWCFDIQDETRGKNGIRTKAWDSCMFPLFTIHTTGHNPRGTKLQRVRQRFMHKLKYFMDKYDDGIMCVGCGRCIRSCPVNIDIRSICEKMNNYEPAK
jgi:ferredoxin